MKIHIQEIIIGSILDIGGGGECTIGQIYGDRGLAIDNLQEELDEAPDCCEKQLMDATDLLFPDNTFDNVTFFFSLMYMSGETQQTAIKEALRVLKPGGRLYVWDTDIRSAYPDPFVIDLDIESESRSIQTTYGILKKETQDSDKILRYLHNAGVKAERTSKNDALFFICAVKV